MNVTSSYLAWAGIATLVLLTLQIVVGMRWIAFKGRTHRLVHKWLGWVLYAVAVMHAVPALVRYFGWRVFG